MFLTTEVGRKIPNRYKHKRTASGQSLHTFKFSGWFCFLKLERKLSYLRCYRKSPSSPTQPWKPLVYFFKSKTFSLNHNKRLLLGNVTYEVVFQIKGKQNPRKVQPIPCWFPFSGNPDYISSSNPRGDHNWALGPHQKPESVRPEGKERRQPRGRAHTAKGSQSLSVQCHRRQPGRTT
jgi:hypothetical protein